VVKHKIQYLNREPKDIFAFVYASLDGTYCDSGVVENAQRTADICREAISRLCYLLALKGFLTGSDIAIIINKGRDALDYKIVEV